MAVHASHSALPYPIKGARYSMLVPFLDADGDPTAQTTPDTEISEDNAAATDAAEEVAATSGMDGMGLITFTGAETDCSCLAANFKAASGPKATLATLYPRVLAVVGSGTLSAGSAGGGTLGTLLAYDVAGCFIKTTGGTGGGGTGGADNQARKIITYNTGTGAFTVAPNWETTPSTDTTYDVLLPEGMTLGMLRALNPTTAGRTLDVNAGGEAGVDLDNTSGTLAKGAELTGFNDLDAAGVRTAVGLGAANLDTQLGAIDDAVDTEVAAILAAVDTEIAAIKAQTDLIPASPAATGDAMTLEDGAITAAKIAADAITADKIAANAIGASELAADAVTEIQAGLSTLTAAGVRTAVGLAAANLDTQLGDIDNFVDEIETRLSAARAGYLDNLNVGGNVASEAQATTIEGYVDELETRIPAALPEPGQAQPTATPGLALAIATLYGQAVMKRTQDGTEAKVHNAAGTVIYKQATADDGTTLTVDRAATGP